MGRNVQLQGFEDAVAQAIADNFRFVGPFLEDVELVTGRHLFVQDMPEVEDIAETEAQAVQPYDPDREPTISIYTTGGELIPTISRGGRHEWALRFVLRLGVVPEDTKSRLEELTEFVESWFPGKIIGNATLGKHQVKAALITSRPSVFSRVNDEHAFATCTFRFLAVSVLS